MPCPTRLVSTRQRKFPDAISRKANCFPPVPRSGRGHSGTADEAASGRVRRHSRSASGTSPRRHARRHCAASNRAPMGQSEPGCDLHEIHTQLPRGCGSATRHHGRSFSADSVRAGSEARESISIPLRAGRRGSRCRHDLHAGTRRGRAPSSRAPKLEGRGQPPPNVDRQAGRRRCERARCPAGDRELRAGGEHGGCRLANLHLHSVRSANGDGAGYEQSHSYPSRFAHASSSRKSGRNPGSTPSDRRGRTGAYGGGFFRPRSATKHLRALQHSGRDRARQEAPALLHGKR